MPSSLAVPDLSAVVLHAYDARNLGDRLLVSETLHILSQVGVRPANTTVVALRADTFDGDFKVFQYPGVPGTGFGRTTDWIRLAGMAAAAVVVPSALRWTRLGRLILNADLVVAAGGGYLRAPLSTGTGRLTCSRFRPAVRGSRWPSSKLPPVCPRS